MEEPDSKVDGCFAGYLWGDEMDDETINGSSEVKRLLEKSERIEALEIVLGKSLTFEQPIRSLAQYMDNAKETAQLICLYKEVREAEEKLDHLAELRDSLREMEEGITDQICEGSIRVMESASRRGKAAAEARHNKPGGSRSKAEEMLRLWASGKYSSRDICAEQECAALGLSFSTARKALRNTPKHG